MTGLNDQGTRAAFEKWMREDGPKLDTSERKPDGRYWSSHTQLAWESWQACATAALRARGAVPSDAVTDTDESGAQGPVYHLLYALSQHDDPCEDLADALARIEALKDEVRRCASETARTAQDAARWRFLSEHMEVAWNEGKFTSLVRIVSEKWRKAINASLDRMMGGDWSDADAAPAAVSAPSVEHVMDTTRQTLKPLSGAQQRALDWVEKNGPVERIAYRKAGIATRTIGSLIKAGLIERKSEQEPRWRITYAAAAPQAPAGDGSAA